MTVKIPTPVIAALAAVGVLGACTVGLTSAQAAPSYAITSFGPVGAATAPDDIAQLGNFVYIGYQNGVGPTGAASSTGVTQSTLQQYNLDGTPGMSWQVTGKLEGLAADPTHNRLLFSTNEDGNSSFHSLVPGTGATVVDYAYSGLTHNSGNGGTDQIAVMPSGQIIVTASSPGATTDPAAYSVQLTGTQAVLTPVFTDNASATAVNGPTAGAAAPIALTDPDSSIAVPASVPTFGGDYLLVGQGDKKLVFATNPGAAGQTLRSLTIDTQVDDVNFATTGMTTLWVADPAHNQIDRVTGFTAGQMIGSSTRGIATIDPTTGVVTPIAALAGISPKGLLFTADAVATPSPSTTPAAPATPVTGNARFTG